MKSLTNYINEKLIVNKNYNPYTYAPKSFDELRKIIEDRYNKLGPGTEQDPIDFNDIDVSNLDSFCNKNKGIFAETKFKYIDISYWDVSNVTNMSYMFFKCKELKSVGDISNWDVSSVNYMLYMFCNCCSFNQNISNWDVSSVNYMSHMFAWCKKFNQDISSWNVSNVTNMNFMFAGCKSFNKDISKWNVLNVTDMNYMFYNCPIKEEYKTKFK